MDATPPRYRCYAQGSPETLFLCDDAAGVRAGVCLSRGAELCSLQLRMVDTPKTDAAGTASGAAECTDGLERKEGEEGSWVEVLDRAMDFSKPTSEWSVRGVAFALRFRVFLSAFVTSPPLLSCFAAGSWPAPFPSCWSHVH